MNSSGHNNCHSGPARNKLDALKRTISHEVPATNDLRGRPRRSVSVDTKPVNKNLATKPTKRKGKFKVQPRPR